MWIHLLLAGSNLLGIPALLSARDYTGMFMVSAVMISSTTMHLTETKHALIPPIGPADAGGHRASCGDLRMQERPGGDLKDPQGPFSSKGQDLADIMLNVDRVVAILASLYFVIPTMGILIHFPKTWRYIFSPYVFPAFGVGLLCMMLGEIKTSSPVWNHMAYPFLHLVWHSSIYYCMYHLMGIA